MATKSKKACVICLDEVDSDRMFSVDNCGHRFCFDCVKQHIEVKLLDGKIPNCPQHRCKSQLHMDRCGKLLNLKLSFMWEQRIKEYSTPFTERIYCPFPKCSYLMSKTELFPFSESGLRRCFSCDGSFCVYCKVPWHSELSCSDYKKSHSNHQSEDAMLKSLVKRQGWRQCRKCKHIVELSYGCNHMVCRCGYDFCYTCGKDSYNYSHAKCISYKLGNYETPAIAFVLVIIFCLFVFLICYH